MSTTPHHATRTAFLVHHFLEHSADAQPDAPFLIQLGTSSSYGEIEAAANRFAQALLAQGLQAGDRVGLLAANSTFYVVAYYGTLKAGGVAVPLNTAAAADTLAHALTNTAARFLTVGARLERQAAAALAAAPSVQCLVAERARALTTAVPAPAALLDYAAALAQASAERPRHVRRVDLDVAAIVHTSGSTGTPRGATLSHRNLVTNTASIVEYLSLSRHDRVLAVLPFYYVYGKTLLNTHAAVGGAVVIENRTVYPGVVLDSLEQQQCTGFAGVPSTYAILLNRSDLARRCLPNLRYLTQAGAAMSPDLTRRLIAAVPGKQLFIMYGATEASARLAYLPPERLQDKLGAIGIAIPNVELRVLRDDGVDAAPGETGELVARGSNIMLGYWNDPDATRDVIDDAGYYHTGDLGQRDDDGFFFVVGRKKDMLKVGGHRIAAKTIEEAISEWPGVHEVAVIGVPDAILGEVPCAYVVMQPSADADADADASKLERFLRGRLATPAMPKHFIFRDDLPKNDAGKIMKQALRDEMQQQHLRAA